ncbi:hypothetical protein IFM61606_07078 [Aspergillus udagawae]|uniref:Uncharacterized protein n=1 Tax=Aspergillus udagawae TaxID=91492 RepID=A0ABQ1AW09_9EURO|nr:hypothetical protein IFM51744_07150 [Aspergillus udagawae]GFF88826.1 hypothetical protein IFM53868_05634 [Aspergillus udagawae]GFG13703.1 hypothetical protein IFM5058_06584 [Aspergillus udagawae]GFG27066.1 hypothetical protein IFM61606_07078 [Aspergillus udagawae]
MSWRPMSGRASIPRKQPGFKAEETRPGGPIRGLAQSTNLAFPGSWRRSRRKNDWPKKKEGDTEAHILVPVDNSGVRPTQY